MDKYDIRLVQVDRMINQLTKAKENAKVACMSFHVLMIALLPCSACSVRCSWSELSAVAEDPK